MLDSTSKFAVKEIIFKRVGFALATGFWDGDNDQLRLACRWYDEDGGIGYPQTFGKPQWMLFPEGIRVGIQNENALETGKKRLSIIFEE